MQGTFSGLRVLDLSEDLAGSICAMLLADHGAEVIKVERPTGDPLRSSSGWRVWNRGKRSVTLDRNTDDGQAKLNKLVASADVLVEGLPAVGLPRIEFSDLTVANPRLIVSSISGYGDVRSHAGRPAVESLVAARTGLQWEKRGWIGGSIERVNQVEGFLADMVDVDNLEGPPRMGPLFSSIPWTSLATMNLLTVGTAAALYARECTGQGQHVSTSMLQGAIVNGAFAWQRVETPTRPGYRMWMTDPRVPHGFFETGDGRWVHNWTPQPSFIANVAARADERDAATKDAANEGATSHAVKNDDLRIGMDPPDMLVLWEFREMMEETFKRFSSGEWEQIAADADVSIVTVKSPEEALLTESFLADGCVAEVDDPDVGPIRHVGLTIHFDGAPGEIGGPAPRLGADSDDVLSEVEGRDARREPSAAPQSAPDLRRGPLDGVLVLDVGLAVAGPYGTQVLADLGAEVIKINRPADRAWTDTYMNAMCNRGKRSLCIDLKSPEGSAVFHDLVRRADVVHSNMRIEAAEGLGLGYESLKQINPAIIVCHTRGYENGPRLGLVGHDQSGSAISGPSWEEGGVDRGGKPIWTNLSLGDTGNGFMSAIAVLQALYHRKRTGQGQSLHTSIAYIHLLNASTAWVSADGSMSGERPRLDAMHYGFDALRRLYETASGWLCVAVDNDEQWRSLCEAVSREDLIVDERFASADARADNDQPLADELAQSFTARSAAEWFDRLDARSVPCEVSAEDFSTHLFDDEEMIANGLVIKHPHELFGSIEMAGRSIDFSHTPGLIERGPCVTGQHTREVLADYGYDDDQIAKLIELGVATQLP